MELDALVGRVSRAADRFSAAAVVVSICATPILAYAAGVVVMGTREYPNGSTWNAFFGGAALGASIVIAFMVWRARLFARRAARVGADERGLVVDGELVAGRDEIDVARVVVRPDFYLDTPAAQVVVHVEARARSTVIDVEVATIEQAQTLMDALDRHVHQRAVGMDAILVRTFSWFVLRRPFRLSIGADGFLVASLLAPRFVRWSEVELVSARLGEVRVSLRSGELIRIEPVRRLCVDGHDRDLDYESIGPCFEAALDTATRRSRGNAERRATGARALEHPPLGFRSPAISADDLAEILVDCAASSKARRAAARLLVLDSPSGAERVLRADRACVDPALRSGGQS